MIKERRKKRRKKENLIIITTTNFINKQVSYVGEMEGVSSSSRLFF